MRIVPLVCGVLGLALLGGCTTDGAITSRQAAAIFAQYCTDETGALQNASLTWSRRKLGDGVEITASRDGRAALKVSYPGQPPDRCTENVVIYSGPVRLDLPTGSQIITVDAPAPPQPLPPLPQPHFPITNADAAIAAAKPFCARSTNNLSWNLAWSASARGRGWDVSGMKGDYRVSVSIPADGPVPAMCAEAITPR